MARKKSGEPILDEALERFEESERVSSENRKDYEDDTRFAALSDQWPDKYRTEREQEGRPCLTINKVKPFIRQVVNESRQNKPGIKVSPVDNGADENTAEVISGIIRSVERNGSGAEVAYDTAIEHAVTGGFGFFRVAIDYAHDDTFDMEAKIERIPNPLMVHYDVNSTASDSSDWDYAFVSDFLTEHEFKTRYPKADPVDFRGSDGDLLENWTQDESVRVAEYWQRIEKKRQLFRLSNGMVVREDDIPKIATAFFEAGGVDLGGQVDDDDLAAMYLSAIGAEIEGNRTVTYFDVKRRVINGVEVLLEDDWPGSTIPICPVWGEEVFLDGRRHFRSMIRDAKDPQQMFNFWRSATTELVALAPRAPFIVAKGSIPPESRGKWETANTRSHAYLEYMPDAGPMPQRQQFASVPAGALQEALNASDDMKAITGIYDSSLGARSNETSGRAILARQRESDVSNFHFIDNLNRAIRCAGKILVEIIPSVYTPREAIRILGEDSKEKVIRLTQEGDVAYQEGIGGQPPLYNLAVGKYDVDVESGPSYATQREESREFLLEIMKSIPGAAPLIGDKVMELMDFQGADEIAKRLKAALPPNVTGENPGPPQGAPGMPPQAPPQQPGGGVFRGPTAQ